LVYAGGDRFALALRFGPSIRGGSSFELAISLRSESSRCLSPWTFESVERQAMRATRNLVNFLAGDADLIQANKFGE